MGTERRTNARLALLGLGSVGLCALLALRYPLPASLANPRAGWADLAPQTWISLFFHLALYLGLTGLQLLALRLALSNRRPAYPQSRARLAIILATWLACSALLMGSASSGESHDIFDYIFRGRMSAEFGGNPLTDTPAEFSRAPFYRYLAWHDHVDAYGPVWEVASAATAKATRAALRAVGAWSGPTATCPQTPLACRNLLAYVVAYRLLAVALTGLSAALIFSMVRRSRARLAEAALIAWLWSPILLVSTAVGAHNDALMVVLLLLMLWLLQRHRGLLAFLVLVLAAHVKLTALIAAPAVGLWLARQLGWRRAIALCALAMGIGAGLSWFLYAPFGGWASLPRMLGERAEFLANSPGRILYSHLYYDLKWTWEASRRLAVGLSNGLFVVLGAGLTLWLFDFRPQRWKARPTPDWRDDRWLWRAVAGVALLYLLVGSFWFQHWYVLWALAPAALMPDGLLMRRGLPWLGFGALAANAAGAFAPGLAAEPLSRTAGAVLVVAVTWGPVFIAAATRRVTVRGGVFDRGWPRRVAVDRAASPGDRS